MSTTITQIDVSFAGKKSEKVEKLHVDYTDAGAANIGSVRFTLPGKVEKQAGPQELVVIFKGNVDTAEYNPGQDTTEIVIKFGRGLERSE